MYKVLIVDDEKEIREGLFSWTWDQLGLQAAGCCAHGLEALQFIADNPVDIVMTDIRMPFMDGIELMETLHRQYPFISVIILSGHSDFEYAQKAIQNGAADYLLKPIHLPTLFAAFEQLIKKLDEKKQNQFRISVLRRKEQQLANVLREDFLRRLFQFPMSPDDIEQGSAEGEVLLDGDCFTAAACRMDRLSLHNRSVTDKELRLLAFSLDNILNDLWDSRQLGYHWVDRNTAEFVLLSPLDNPEEAFTAMIAQLERYMGLFKSTFSIGIGPQVSRQEDIHLSVQAAGRSLRQCLEQASVSHAAEEGDTTAGTLAIEKITPPRESSALPTSLKMVQDLEQNNVILVQAKQFIRDNYNRSLTLKEAADRVYVSQGHLSALFKEAGDTYLKFLTAIRMQKAIELLNEPNIKIYEVVERVGYNDSAYFSEVFKKHTGKTPNEFRSKTRWSAEG